MDTRTDHAPAHPALPVDHPLRDGRTTDSALVTALAGRPTAGHPVWFMRQAGRSLPEYRAIRAGVAMLDSCLDPDLASEITLQPVRRHGVDAAVLFSDIVVPLKLAGVDVDIVPGTGPVVAHPVRTAADVAALPVLDPAALAPVAEAVARTVAQLGTTPLVGFAGAPFTLASYLVEGGPSREHLHTKAMMHADPASWHALADWVAGITSQFLHAQVLAGASAVQLFDSWAGALSLADYQAFVAPHSAGVLSRIGELGVPRLHFGVGTGELLVAMRDAGADAMGIDHRIPLDVANSRLGGRTPLQGNIDPALLFAGDDALHAHAAEVIERGRAAPGHVVNLGHGVPPTTDPEVLTRLVAFIHDQP
ncbi:uroporphyrinogen decarboxylase [Nakamurella flavida]|uniref:Uroporphyrinogen decarboxylase n=1 Tax=Nakamurella flavida TaxID=363630 RepID=A0A939C0V9_9ACTN|nr:uroporphyrinogen decarboxylase [Nakamurella flavida]MBM9477118.1 uroporphyrinogen decarboxylase [Nakamurella flavida]MDP9780064.1 uroporphyrinogen decarboxylase [Nakamurella flavida]